LRAAGHAVSVIHVRAGREDGVSTATYQGLPVTVFAVRSPSIPFVRNLVKNERLWARLEQYLVSRLRAEPMDVIHAQHVMTTIPAVGAGHALGTPVVATVRDYWPVCYWSDLIYDPSQPHLCPGCSAGMMTRCLKPRAGAATPLAWLMIPYMRRNLRTKQEGLARASAVIAVSSVIGRDLVARAPELDASRVHVIPNPFDIASLDRAYDVAVRPAADPYVLYVGKLATNKGVQFLLPALSSAGVSVPLVVVGDGPLRGDLEADARARGLRASFIGWRDRDEVWAWMRHALFLAFPSYGPESLSRVLVEAAALGAPIAAMATGGTPDIIRDRVTGLLSDDAPGLARDIRALATDDQLRQRLGTEARRDVRARFDARGVVEQVERVYRQVLDQQPRS
jgi:glycosyltransferase involved in cell wall biosynthesis